MIDHDAQAPRRSRPDSWTRFLATGRQGLRLMLVALCLAGCEDAGRFQVVSQESLNSPGPYAVWALDTKTGRLCAALLPGTEPYDHLMKPISRAERSQFTKEQIDRWLAGNFAPLDTFPRLPLFGREQLCDPSSYRPDEGGRLPMKLPTADTSGRPRRDLPNDPSDWLPKAP